MVQSRFGVAPPTSTTPRMLSTAILQRIECGEYPLSDKNAEALAGVLGIRANEYRAA